MVESVRVKPRGIRGGRRDTAIAPRVAVITGAASGIGRALATALAARGDIVTVADIDADRADRVAAELVASHPGHADAAGVDVRDATTMAGMVASVRDRHGRLDLMFNNAGIGVGGAAEEHTLEHWERAIDINLRGVVHGVLAAYPIMLEQGHGHIINTASLAGLVPTPLKTAYTATKHAVVGLSLGLRSEAAANGVRVSVVCPGYVDTPLLDNVNADLPPTADSPHARDRALRVQGRLYDPQRLARDVLRGIERDQAVIVGPAFARVAWWIARLTPDRAIRNATKVYQRLHAREAR